MEQGIIRDVKLHYRFSLLSDLITKNLTLTEYFKELNIKEAIRMLAESWEKISISNVRESFAKLFPPHSEIIHFEHETPNIQTFIELINKIPECVEKNYNQERLEFWLTCDEAEPVKERIFPGLYDVKDDHLMEDQEESLKIYENYQEEIPTEYEVITESELKEHCHVLEEGEILHEETEIDILTQSQQDEIVSTVQLKTSDDDFLYDECVPNEVNCEQAINALDVVLNFMKSDSESRYRDVVFLMELKKKLRRRFEDFSELKEEKEGFI